MSSSTVSSVPLRQLWAGTAWPERVLLGSTVATLAATSWYLLPFWREQAELSHGYFALPCALGLLWQSRREPNWIATAPSARVATLQWTISVAGAFAACVAAFAALAQGPLHTQTAFLVGGAVSLFVLSSVIALARRRPDWVRCNGASLAAALLWWFAVPLPSGTLSRFTLLLQDMITGGSLRALHLVGYAAIRHGNVIQLANTLVGVEEACSGIRSLTACLFAGVVLGGFMLPGLGRRIAVIIGSGVIAIVANFFRSTALCVMAARGIEINGFWHDTTAYAVLGVTALALFGGCLLLSPKTSPPTAASENLAPGKTAGAFAPHLAFATIVALFLGLVFVKTLSVPGSDRAPPDLRALLVLDTPGWQRHSDQSIFQYSAALNTPYLRQESYLRGDTRVTFYVAFWGADQSTLGSVALHTPDICLPGSGWNTLHAPPALARYPLPNPQRLAFEKDAQPEYMWFWHFFGGRVMNRTPSLMPWRLAPLLLKGGVSAKAPQWVIRVSSNQPMESLLQEPLVQEFFARLHAQGLAGEAGD